MAILPCKTDSQERMNRGKNKKAMLTALGSGMVLIFIVELGIWLKTP